MPAELPVNVQAGMMATLDIKAVLLQLLPPAQVPQLSDFADAVLMLCCALLCCAVLCCAVL